MLTLLTHPSYTLKHKLKRWKRKLLRQPMYHRGHATVTKSLLDGLSNLHIDCNCDPESSSQIGEHVHVLSGIDALQKMIELKKRGVVKRLTAGPNLVVSSAEANGIIASPYIDRYLVPSQWVADAYIYDNKNMDGRISCWYAGVDASKWDTNKSQPSTNKLRYLIYQKCSDDIFMRYKAVLERHKVSFETIRYGAYTLNDLRNKLSNTDIAIVLSPSESQGIALFEMWASDIPTYVWNPGIFEFHQTRYKASSAPYLTRQTGRYFANEQELDILLGEHTLQKFSPRQWILDNGTLEICAKSFLEAINYKYL